MANVKRNSKIKISTNEIFSGMKARQQCPELVKKKNRNKNKNNKKQNKKKRAPRPIVSGGGVHGRVNK